MLSVKDWKQLHDDKEEQMKQLSADTLVKMNRSILA